MMQLIDPTKSHEISASDGTQPLADFDWDDGEVAGGSGQRDANLEDLQQLSGEIRPLALDQALAMICDRLPPRFAVMSHCGFWAGLLPDLRQALEQRGDVEGIFGKVREHIEKTRSNQC